MLILKLTIPTKRHCCRSAAHPRQSRPGGDAAAAAEDARSCLSVDPGYIKGWFRLASALAALEDKPAMREAAQKGLQLDPANRELMEILKS